MPLMVFDIDGTLTQTTGLDDRCFIDTLDEVLGLRGVDPDWAHYPHATDSGLIHEITLRYRGSGPTAEEVAIFHARFCEKLREAAAVAGRIVAVPGAAALLAAIAGRSGWGAALATGAWRESARIKLAAAGLGVEGLPAAFADDAWARADIAAFAIGRALGRAFDPGREAARAFVDRVRPETDGIIYVGDGVWDLSTARTLGLGFIGVRVDGDPERLIAEGADPRAIVGHFEPLAAMMDRLHAAARNTP